MRTRDQFLREWIESIDHARSDKSWKERASTKDISGVALFYIFVDMDYFCLWSPIAWTPRAYRNAALTVPKGFVTDSASVPRIFWSLLPPIGRYGYAALFHDFVYWQQTTTRSQADQIFRDTMTELQVSQLKRETMYWAVRLFGFLAWRSNAAAKKAGEKRILKDIPSDVGVRWVEWKKNPNVFLQ